MSLRRLPFGKTRSRATLGESGSERDRGLNTFIPLALAVQSLTGEYSLTPTSQKRPRGSTKQKAVKGSLRGYAILNCLVLTLHLFCYMRSFGNSAREETRGRFLLLWNCQESLLAGYSRDWEWMSTGGRTSLSEYVNRNSKIRDLKQHNYHHEFNLVSFNYGKWLTQHFVIVGFSVLSYFCNLSGIFSEMQASLMTRPAITSASISISVLTAAPCNPLCKERKY